MQPELKLLILNAVILLIAYFGIYPSMRRITLPRMMAVDMVLTVLALVVAGALFWDSGTRFSLLIFSTNWAVFTVLTLLVMEVPLFIWFCRRHGIDLTSGD